MGETRDQRLAEFVAFNPMVPVLGLPEGDWLRVRGGEITLDEPFAVKRLRAGQESSVVESGAAVTI